MRRHLLSFRWLHSEASSVDFDAVAAGRLEIQKHASWYGLNNIYKMDKTASEYCMAPSSTTSRERIASVKKAKTRMTMAVTTNADGSDKIPASHHRIRTTTMLYSATSISELNINNASSR